MNLSAWSPKVLSLLRVVSGLLFLQHGLQKVVHFPPPPPGAAAKAAAAAPQLAKILSPAAGPIELVGGILIIIGLFSRVVAFVCAGEMAFAYFLAHAPRGFYPVLNGGDAAILYCFVFFYLVFAGPGPISIDALLKKSGSSPGRP